MIKVNSQEIKLIIGLGNPGKEYQKTYHNAGFLAIDFWAKKPFLVKLLKSDAYMNQSGSFVSKAIKKNGLKTEELLVIHDDSDIELGKYKLCFGRGSAGHQGVASIIKSLVTKDFWRLRIGIRKIPGKKAEEFVLKKINKKDLEILFEVFKEISENILHV